MSVKKTQTNRREGRNPKFQDAIDKLLNYPRTRTENMKQLIYKDYHVSAKGYNDYYNTLDKGTAAAEELHKMLNEIYSSSTATPFYKYSQAFSAWNDKYKMNVHPHHEEYSNIASQLRAIYEGLLDIQEDPALGFGQKDGRNALVYSGQITNERGQSEATFKPEAREKRQTEPGYIDRSRLADLKGQLSNLLPKVIEDFRNLYIIALAVSRYTNIDGDVDDLVSITQNFVDDLDQAEYDIIKGNHVNVMSGIGKMEIQVVSEDINKMLGKYEGTLGTWSQQLLANASITDRDFAKVQKEVDFSKLVGSKAVKDEITRQVADLVTKGKTTPSKSNSKKKKKVTKKKARKTQRVNKKNTNAVTKPGGRAAVAAETGNAMNTMSLARLRSSIQRRLPAEVRRNMGKPALTNRSGTFSNSPQLLSIREAPTGLTGDYTYMRTGGGTPPRTGQRGVYGTFENSGRWDTAYAPRELIKTSIRELAMEIAGAKFVQLRRL